MSTAVESPAIGDDARVRPLNLLFVLTDQWRFSAFGHGSDEIVRTPHIDDLAASGVLCTSGYSANPLCTPNRASILTGRYAHQHGLTTNDLMLPPQEVCWPQSFRDSGYATHYIGKWHIDGPEKPGFVPPGWRRRGFDTFEGFNRGHFYHRQSGYTDDGNFIGDIVSPVEGSPYFEPAAQTDLAIDFMRRNIDQPFVCALSWGPPHNPFTPPDEFNTYEPGSLRLRPNVPEHAALAACDDLAGYYGLCEALDHEVGRLIQFIDQSGLADNTIVVFTSDHGEMGGSHGKFRKMEPEEESLHVPLIFWAPQVFEAGSVCSAAINSVDLMPTLLGLFDLVDPGSCVGTDKSAYLLGTATEGSTEAIFCDGRLTHRGDERPSADDPIERGSWRAVVTDRYKAVIRYSRDNVDQLFDLRNDPFELLNLAKDPGHKAVADDLLAEYHRSSTETADPYPDIPQRAQRRYAVRS